MTEKFLAEAAKYNLYTTNNAPAEAANNDFFVSKLQRYKDAELSKIIPFSSQKFEAGVFGELKKDTYPNESDRYYFARFTILFFNGETVLQLKEHKGKYYLYPPYRLVDKLGIGVNWSQQKEYLKELPEPNKIGVFTDSKMAAWFDYYGLYIAALEQCQKDIHGKKAKNIARIDSIIAMFPQAKQVNRSQDLTWCTIYLEGFRIELEVLDNGNYLNEKVVYTGNVEKLNNLLNNH